ncbi:MAG TPA: hypothetical protein VNQ32_07665 [Steroidobacteraceae bacterium]|nr:hypothetical protein [Steroidobacteraceae bacterium]
MKQARIAILAIGLAWSVPAITAQPAAASNPAATCDRECLRGAITTYLDALVRHDVSRLPLADKVRITEDCVEKTLDKVGLVRSVTKLRGYRQDFVDERQGIAGTHVVVEEGGAPVLLVVRLKVEGEKISEMETLATRSKAEGSLFRIDGVENTSFAMNYAPKKSQLNTREEMIRIALLYPAGLETESFVTVNAPFTPDAYRLENGEMMAGPDCTRNEGCKNIKTQPLGGGSRGKVEARVAAVDERMGIVWLRMAWGGNRPPRDGGQRTELTVWEAFKIYDGQIHAVEAFMKNMPVGLGSGWPDLNIKR